MNTTFLHTRKLLLDGEHTLFGQPGSKATSLVKTHKHTQLSHLLKGHGPLLVILNCVLLPTTIATVNLHV